jgi:hypothetical protein
MATIRWTIYDDEGNEIQSSQQTVASQLETMDQIEAAVEALRQETLPQVSKTLFEQSQKAFKKKSVGP